MNSEELKQTYFPSEPKDTCINEGVLLTSVWPDTETEDGAGFESKTLKKNAHIVTEIQRSGESAGFCFTPDFVKWSKWLETQSPPQRKFVKWGDFM